MPSKIKDEWSWVPKTLSKEGFLDLLPEREITRKNKSLGARACGIHYAILGNFTVIMIVDSKGIWPGVTKRMPTDRPSDAGMKEAAVRAWRLWQGRDPGYCRMHPISKRGAKKMAALALVERLTIREVKSAFA